MRIPTSKPAAMSHLLMLVSTGYRYYTRGEMHYSKAAGFAAKIANLYPVNATADMRSHAKRTGRYSAFLIMYPHEKDPLKIMFWLLATKGGAPKGYVDIHAREKLSDVFQMPLSWRDQYECVHLEKEGRAGSRWTWRMKKDYFARLDSSAKEAADAGRDALKQFFGMLSHMPMFAGIRAQVVALDKCARATWKKQRKTAYPDPLRPESAKEGSDAASWLPVMPKISVWGDLTLEILIEKLAESEQQRKIAGAAEAATVIADAQEELLRSNVNTKPPHA